MPQSFRRKRICLIAAGRLAKGTALLSAAFLLFLGREAFAQTCRVSNPTISIAELTGDSPSVTNNCFGGSGFRCYAGSLRGSFFRKTIPSCDPNVGSGCTSRLVLWFEYPGLDQMLVEDGSGAPFPLIFWFDEPTVGTCASSCVPPSCPPACSPAELGICGLSGTASRILDDFVETRLDLPAYTCAAAEALNLQYSVLSRSCPTGCEKDTPINSIFVGGPNLARALGCLPPPPSGCAEGSDGAGACCVGAAGSTPTTGQAPGFVLPEHAAALAYQGGGTGNSGLPGAESWRVALGRNWSHEFAQRIVLDPIVGNDSVVWLQTQSGTFRKFSGLSAGVYTSTSPSDEYRTLRRTTGWELEELDGAIHAYDSAGKWLSTTDVHGNATSATYNGSGQLTTVTFADGRSDAFTYAASGKLATIVSKGTDGSTRGTWSLTWTGDDLTRVDQPDNRDWRFVYGDTKLPGYMTRMIRVSTTGTERIEGAWEYDVYGNVTKSWKGSNAFDSAAVDKWQFSYDDPADPTVTTVTDPLGGVSTHTFERDPVSNKPRVLSISGDCPTCGSGPNMQYEYLDPDPQNALRPTIVTNGRGVTTEYEYDEHGRTTRRTDGANDPLSDPTLPRITDWSYNVNFPSLVESISGPYVSGASPTRIQTFDRDLSTGHLLQSTIFGVESTYEGGSFSIPTEYDYTLEGQLGLVDPLGYDAVDRTSFTYTTASNGLLPQTRVDPLVGTTTFEYDVHNRRTAEIDPNGLRTETTYDALNRVTTTLVEAAIGSGLPDLVTIHTYNIFGDLFCTKYPRGNGVARFYDAAGRLTEVQRGTAVASPSTTACLDATNFPRERTFYTLDGAGNRTLEQFDRDEAGGSAIWDTHAKTAFEYANRCQLDQVKRGAGAPEESVTKFTYDCAGNLASTAEAFGTADESTTTFAYDAIDRLVSTTQTWGGSEGGSTTTSYIYDVQDHLIGVTDAESNSTTYTYSDRDLMTEQVSPVTGTSSFSYNEHGELISETDGRGLTTARAVDAADRVTTIDYPGSTPDTSFAYSRIVGDIGEVDITQVGHLFSITRGPYTVAYDFDEYWRLRSDGELAFSLDANGNRSTVTYPQGITVRATYDFADRPVKLELQEGAGAFAYVIGDLTAAASYRAFGPLASLPFANGRTENRLYDSRFSPVRIETVVTTAPTTKLLDWDYAVDPMGDVTSIDDLLVAGAAPERSFGYQAQQRFLTCAAGPWSDAGSTCVPTVTGNPLLWSYDKLGNRLTEDRAGAGSYSDDYVYVQNAASKNTAILDKVNRGGGLLRDYTFDAGGFLDAVSAGGNTIEFGFDAAGQLAQTSRPLASEQLDYSYDGRGFLASAKTPSVDDPPPCPSPTGAVFCDGFESVNFACWSDVTGGVPGGNCPWLGIFDELAPIYSSEGMLHGLDRLIGSTTDRRAVLYLGDRPVLLWSKVGTGVSTLTYLTTDHLGTPILAMNGTGTATWAGGFEPFGRDWQEGSSNDALARGIFLRLPGQWDDAVFGDSTLGAEASYNVNRWYDSQTARFSSGDPLGLSEGINLFSYSFSRPLRYIDPLGLASYVCDRPLKALGGEGTKSGPDEPTNPLFHQYFCVVTPDGTTDCHGQTAATKFPWGPGEPTTPEDDYFDQKRCKEIEPDNDCFEKCLQERGSESRPAYGLVGPLTNCKEWTGDAVIGCRQRCDSWRRKEPPYCATHPDDVACEVRN